MPIPHSTVHPATEWANWTSAGVHQLIRIDYSAIDLYANRSISVCTSSCSARPLHSHLYVSAKQIVKRTFSINIQFVMRMHE